MSRSLKRGIISVLFANIINLIFNLITNFILPKYLSVDSYAAIKTYQLYVSYAGAAALGYIDGMYLKYGGKELSDINHNDLTTNLSTARIFQIVVSIVLVFIGVLLHDNVFIAFACSVLPINMSYYFRNLYQAVGEFNKYGRILNLTTGATFLVNMVLLLVVKTDYFIYYLIGYVTIYFLIWLLLEWNVSRKGSFKQSLFSFSFKELIESIKSGILLLLGNFSSIIMTGMDRWFVKALMDTLAFAQYSFAVSIEGFINVAMSPITVTLYNYFCKGHTDEEVKKIRNCVMIFAVAIVSLAFPARFILEIYLKNYIDSSRVMFYLFAAQIFYIIIKSIYVNLYKAEKQQTRYFIKLLLVLGIGFLFNVVCYWIHNVKESFALGTLLSAISWYFLSIPDFKWMGFKFKEFLYPFLMMGIFLACGFLLNAIPGFIVYSVLTIIISMLFLTNEFKYLTGMLKSKIKH